MDAHLQHLKKMSSSLQEEMQRCAETLEVESVHHLRTGTRKVQAMAETIVRETAPGDPELQNALRKWLKTLKRIRRAAGPVRDLDVHRKLLEKLVEQEIAKAAEAPEQPVDAIIRDPGGAAHPLQQEAERFDTWLKHSREPLAAYLAKEIQKQSAKVIRGQEQFEAAVAAHRDGAHRRARSATGVALDDFARLSIEHPYLHESNLHDFRKGTKKARYVAESAEENPELQEVAKALKKLQDEIGDWHDWLMMAEEARRALGDEGSELISLLDRKVASHYSDALLTASKLRGRLMGEWEARLRKPVRGTGRASGSAAAANWPHPSVLSGK